MGRFSDELVMACTAALFDPAASGLFPGDEVAACTAALLSELPLAIGSGPAKGHAFAPQPHTPNALFSPEVYRPIAPDGGAARQGRRLTDLEREVRAKLHLAANLAIRRVLEKAGAKVVTKARTAAGAQVRELATGVPLHLVPAAVGPALVASLGLTEQALIDSEFAEFHQLWDDHVRNAQEQALATSAKLARADPPAALRAQLAQARQLGWRFLVGQMRRVAVQSLSTPTAPNDSVPSDDSSDRPVADSPGLSLGLMRVALSIAGGMRAQADSTGRVADPTQLGGVTGGPIVDGFMQDQGAEVEYVWNHGPSDRPFEPHLELDGVRFRHFDDSRLVVEGSFPDTGFYCAGDHDGCSCDLDRIYSVPADSEPIAASAGVALDYYDVDIYSAYDRDLFGLNLGRFAVEHGPNGEFEGGGSSKSPEQRASMLKTYREARAAGKGHNSAVKAVSDAHGVSKESVSGHLTAAREAEKAAGGKTSTPKPVAAAPEPKVNGKTAGERASMLKTYREARAAGKGHNSAVGAVAAAHGVGKESVPGHLTLARSEEKAAAGKAAPATPPAPSAPKPAAAANAGGGNTVPRLVRHDYDPRGWVGHHTEREAFPGG